MKRKYTNRRYLDALQERVLIFDGAMGTNLQTQALTPEHFGGEKTFGCNDYLVITYPHAVEKVHRSFLEVGVDVIETDTFRSNPLTLAEYGLSDRAYEINLAAAILARRLADEYSTPDQPRFVAGSIGPSGKLPSADDPELSDISFDTLADLFRQQALGLLQGGVDVCLLETSQDILEAKAAIMGVHQAFADTGIYLPIQVQVTLDTTGRMLLGTDIAAALAILEGLEIDVIGLNCSTGPEHMYEPIAYLGEQTTLPVSCIPNAGLPLNVDGAIAAVLCELDFPPEMGNGFFAIARTVGLTAHVFDEVTRQRPAHAAGVKEVIGGVHQPGEVTALRLVPFADEPAPEGRILHSGARDLHFDFFHCISPHNAFE